MRYLILLVLFLLPYSTNAFSFVVDPDPAPIDQTQSTVEATCAGTDVNTGENWVLYYPNGEPYFWDWCNNGGYDPGFLNDWLSNSDPEGTYTVRGFGFSEDSEAWWTTTLENLPEISEATSVSTFCYVACSESENATWGSANGFWGDDFSAGDIAQTMEASVQATGFNVWPLMTFVGIPIAFLIALYLIWLINKTLTPPKKSDDSVINPQGKNFIYHSAEDLEFKREYGQVKRKRGRPRKYPL